MSSEYQSPKNDPSTRHQPDSQKPLLVACIALLIVLVIAVLLMFGVSLWANAQ